MKHVRSASRYAAFAEQGAGRPGLFSRHSAIHSRLVVAFSCCGLRFWMLSGSDGVEGDVELGVSNS
jgi:hypothetical protein